MSENEGLQIDVADFLEVHSSLFVVLGVFSALAIYISDLGGGSIETAAIQIRIGFGGSLLLSFLVVVLIYRQMVDYAGSLNALIGAHGHLKNWDLIIFTGGLALLLPSLVIPVLQRLITLYYLILVLGVLFSVPILFRTAIRMEQYLAEDGVIRHIELLVISGFLLASVLKYLEYLRSNPRVAGTAEFSLSNLSPVFYDTTGVIAVALQGALIALIFSSAINLLQTVGNQIRAYSQ